ncbi:MAG: alpha-2-macroglobulin family protein [bacterium]
MKNSVFISLIAALVFIMLGSIAFPPQDYDKLWEKVYQLEADGLPRSALDVVDNIYREARAEGNQPQLLKALIYRISLKSRFEEDHLADAIGYFESELSQATPPSRQIIHSLLGEMYMFYYQQNRWKINNRGVVTGYDEENIQTWDAVKLTNTARSHYLSSLVDSMNLQEINLKEFTPILINSQKENFMLFPTLYDLLANRTLEFLTSHDALFFDFKENLIISDPKYMSPAADFMRMTIPEGEVQQQVLVLFQHLLKLHAEKQNEAAFVDIDLRRLEYVYNNSNQTDEEEQNYIAALRQLGDQYRESKLFVKIAARLAKRYITLGQKYDAAVSDEHRYDLVRAEEICQMALDKYPMAEEGVECRRILQQLNEKEYSFQVESAVLPGKESPALISFRNVTRLHMKAVKLSSKELMDNFDRIEKDSIRVLKRRPASLSWTVEIPDTKDHQSHALEIAVPALEAGYYLLFASADSNYAKDEHVSYQILRVTDLGYFTRQDQQGKHLEVLVFRRETGQAVPDAEVTAFEYVYNPKAMKQELRKLSTAVTKPDGAVTLDVLGSDRQKHVIFTIRKDNDFVTSEHGEYLRQTNIDNRFKTKTYLFTDRSIYRPGQTVYFKGLVIKRNKQETLLCEAYTSEVELLNVNGKKVSTTEVRTNEFGSYQGSFILPTASLNGRMTLKTPTGSVGITVEEYKRPTFQVVIDSLHDTYKIGDTLTIKGRAETFAGAPVSGAEVKYRVVRRPLIEPYYRYYSPLPEAREVTVAQGNTTTKQDGQYQFEFPARNPGYKKTRPAASYRFTIFTEVLDMTGEVQTSHTDVVIGKQSVLLNFETSGIILQESESQLLLTARNYNGHDVEVDVNLNVYQLHPPQRLLHQRYWKAPDMDRINESDFHQFFPHLPFKEEGDRINWRKDLVQSSQYSLSGKANVLSDFLSTADPGEYMMEAVYRDDSQDSSVSRKFITIYSNRTAKLPGNMIHWSTVDKEVAEPGEMVSLSVGSAAKRSRFYYEIINGEDIVDRKWVTVSKNQKTIQVPVLESYRGGFEIRTVLARYNRIYIVSHRVEVPFSNKKLDITLVTKRDYLTPGTGEKWQVRIQGPEGEKAAAELLAGMYDASLDQFTDHDWKLKLYASKRARYGLKSGFFHGSGSRFITYRQQDFPALMTVRYPQINWFNYQFYGTSRFGSDAMLKSVANMRTDQGEAVEQQAGEIPVQQDTLAAESPSEIPDKPENNLYIRSDFRETAFFYPQLHTDSSGSVMLSFTTPDALTEWKLMLLAHDRDLKTGWLTRTIKAKKDLMIIPNLPRFLRQGDGVHFTAKLINFSDESMEVSVDIDFFNPVTDKSIDILQKGKQASKQVTLPANESKVMEWLIAVPDNISMLAYRVKAVSAKHTDAEERMIPVLSNRMLVTETLPMHVRGKEERKFTLDKLRKQDKVNDTSLKNYRLTVEFTSHPAWYAIQALPYLEEPLRENASGLFYRLYANLLSAYIVNQHPRIKKVFQSWQTNHPDTFYSALMKNESLKNTVLEATPWVLEAEEEAEQKRRIALLFDMNKMAGEKQAAIEKLRESQLSNGGWPWFKGMRDDRHITQQIVLGMARLAEKQVIMLDGEPEIKSMLNRAVRYLDGEFYKDYTEHKKRNTSSLGKDHLGSNEIEYLFARSLLINHFPLPAEVREAFEYYTKQEEQYWLKKNNYLQSMIALTLHKLGKRNIAEGIRRSLNERALYNEELGMYWRQEQGWHWYEAPIETQAMLIELFASVGNDPQAVEQMKIWLLKQKQTTRWKNTSSTAEAIYALLLTGDDLLVESEGVSLIVGGKPLNREPAKTIAPEAGTGYFKTSWSGEEIKAEMGDMEVKNPNSTIVWGAAYWQYFQALDKITEAETPLKITRQLFTEIATEDGPVLTPIPSGQQINLGDKIIVRLIISSDRTMDYIHVRDLRAAALEPFTQQSGYSYQGGLWYYQNLTDISMDFFIRTLPKGTYVLEYPLKVTQRGEFSNGMASIQSIYAPEFASHSKGFRMTVE